MKQASEDKSDIFCVFNELKSLGVKVPKVKKFKSSIPKQAVPVSAVPSSSGKIFGVHLSQQERICVADYFLPKFIVTSTSYLKKFTKREIGLFRKAGSVVRQRDLRVKLENGESIEDSEPNDVASLLKQWLRELPEPLIPSYLQDLFVRCQSLQTEENRLNAVLLCCHLLPVDHLYTLRHLLDFLSEIAIDSDKNKMGAHNLAVIMAPNIFVMGTDSINKSSNSLIQQHTSIIELLINNVHRIDEMPSCSSLHLAETEALKYSNDLDLSIDILDCSPPKSKKKRKSGPVQDLFTGFRKLVGQNSLSPNPARRLNQDDCKSTESRSASKRKAEPDQLSMSPFKKLATASNVSRNDTLNVTPHNKSTQNIFGMRERAYSAQSQRKPFGLLKRKEKKRQKSMKSNISIETKITVSTPYSFPEKLNASYKDNSQVQDTCVDKTTSILSPFDIEKLFSKPISVRKSISDCYLDVPKVESKNKCLLLTSSSEGCLVFEESNQSPYYLRYDSKRAIKRKSDVLNSKPETSVQIVEEDNEKDKSRCSPWFNRKNSKDSPSFKRRSPNQNLSPKDENTLSDTVDSFSEDKSSLISKDLDKINSLNLLQVPIQRNSSRKRNSVSKKEKTSSPEEKSVHGKDPVRSDIIDVNDSVPNVISVQSCVTSTVSSIQTTNKVKRNCSINRQEAFIIKPNTRKKTLTQSQLKRADSIKISKSKNNCSSHQSSDLNRKGKINEKDGLSSSTEVNSHKKNETSASFNVSDKKRTRRNARNGSIVRGRPNTVKTGLPSYANNRHGNESLPVNNDHELVSSTSVDSNLLVNVSKQSKDNDFMSVTLQIQNITLSSPKEGRSATKDDIQNCTFHATINDDGKTSAEITVRETETVTEVKEGTSSRETSVEVNSARVRRSASRRKVRDRLYSNSDSKIHKMKKKSSKVSRINSFPEPNKKLKHRDTKKLRAVKSSSPRKSLEKKVTNSVEVEKENVCIQESSDNPSNITVVKTPEMNTETPETWVSGKKFLQEEEATEEETFNKRESIAMILKSNPGNVRAKAYMYDSVSTPMSLRSSTPGSRLYDSQRTNVQAEQSGKRSASVKSTRSMRRNSPLPPPPKFVISESPLTSSYPLKELTNISNSEDSVFSASSPAKKSLSSPVKTSIEKRKVKTPVEKKEVKTPIEKKEVKTPTEKKEVKTPVKKLNKKCTLKPKRNSYSGHTPYKLIVERNKVFRSESSPLLLKVANESRDHLTAV